MSQRELSLSYPQQEDAQYFEPMWDVDGVVYRRRHRKFVSVRVYQS
ncbi:MAG: hypothetical protein RMX97_30730 [Nostoc sp. DedQUE11]|nr:hypothetical protein [Nostoc sp. DedQUE11]